MGSAAGPVQDTDRLDDVGLVVLDEVHYLGDPDRGSVWEEVIINCPPHIRLLCMSATVANPDELGGWISQVQFHASNSGHPFFPATFFPSHRSSSSLFFFWFPAFSIMSFLRPGALLPFVSSFMLILLRLLHNGT